MTFACIRAAIVVHVLRDKFIGLSFSSPCALLSLHILWILLLLPVHTYKFQVINFRSSHFNRNDVSTFRIRRNSPSNELQWLYFVEMQLIFRNFPSSFLSLQNGSEYNERSCWKIRQRWTPWIGHWTKIIGCWRCIGLWSFEINVYR